MTQREYLGKTSPAAYKAMVGLQMASAAGLDPVINELIKIRSSQLNGCAYCVHMHVSDALKMGIDNQKLHMIAVWHEAPDFFSEREKVALEYAEAVTRIGDGGVSDDLHARVQEQFDPAEAGQLLAAIAMINVWNRVALATGRVAGTDERVARAS
jgi:AhpD family alkylhydroperoxidase